MHYQQMVDLLAELVRIESVTPYDNGAQALLASKLREQGFFVEHIDAPPVSNLWARIGCHAPLLVFAGHTDVVPTGALNQWHTPPFEPVIKENRMHGRGTCDMKGALAAMVAASHRFLAKHPSFKGSLGFLITSGEEGDEFDLGTPHVMKHLAEQGTYIDYCIVGEPSSTHYVGDVIKVGRRGSLTADVIVHGKQGHVAYPQQARNPIHLASPALADLSALRLDEGNAYFPPSSLQITQLHAGTGAGNVIPGELQCQFNVRYSSEITHDQIIQQIETLLKQTHALDISIQWRLNGKPFLTKASKLIEATQYAIEQLTQQQCHLSTSGGTSDGRFIAPYGTEVIELGPCNDSIHQVNEYTDLQQLWLLSNIYESICHQLLF